jgi:NAD(P)-dependent dehydrogenase (short-subunit alcohol dehydrogenase family)
LQSVGACRQLEQTRVSLEIFRLVGKYIYIYINATSSRLDRHLSFNLASLPYPYTATNMATSSAATGKTIVVTGGAGGLGKQIALSLLEAGANVAICDVNQVRLKEVEVEWAQYAEKVLVMETDVTSEECVPKFFDAATAKFGRIDMLVNNSGIMDTFDGVSTMTKQKWDQVLAVNTTGPFLCTKAAVNAMEAQSPPGGTIINIASVSSVKGSVAGVAYTASKHALLGIMRNTAFFYGPKGIFSIALLMGSMNTNIPEVSTGSSVLSAYLLRLSDPLRDTHHESGAPGYVMFSPSTQRLMDMYSLLVIVVHAWPIQPGELGENHATSTTLCSR